MKLTITSNPDVTQYRSSPLKSVHDQSSTQSNSIPKTPWLIVCGIVGIVLAAFGVPVPILTCLLLVGVGADADLARRAQQMASLPEATAWSPVVTGLFRFLHGMLYAVIFVIAWASLLDLCQDFSDRLFVAGDLVVSIGLLVFLVKRR